MPRQPYQGGQLLAGSQPHQQFGIGPRLVGRRRAIDLCELTPQLAQGVQAQWRRRFEVEPGQIPQQLPAVLLIILVAQYFDGVGAAAAPLAGARQRLRLQARLIDELQPSPQMRLRVQHREALAEQAARLLAQRRRRIEIEEPEVADRKIATIKHGLGLGLTLIELADTGEHLVLLGAITRIEEWRPVP